MNISVFGLGKLGATMVACFAYKGWNVIGVDVNEAPIQALNCGQSPISEPGVSELIKANRSLIRATTDAEEAILNSGASFIIVPTPSKDDGSFSTEYVMTAIEKIGKALRKSKNYHLVVVTSTVLPGDMIEIQNRLEEASDRKVGDGYGLCYNPEFIALGRIIKDFLNPDIVLIGQSDEKAGACLKDIHKNLVENKPEIIQTNFYNAELIKISINTYCVMKINFANTLAEICENMPRGDAHLITYAMGSDSRIGRKYFKPGLSVAGPCFPRDGRAFIQSASRFHVNALMAAATDEMNNYQKERIVDKIIGDLKPGMIVSILGLAYKEDTGVIEESVAIYVAQRLLDEKHFISIYDPSSQAVDAAMSVLSGGVVVRASSIEECLKDSSYCFIATPWDEFKNLKPENFSSMKNPVVLDAWNLLTFASDSGIQVKKIGVNSI